MQETRMNKNSKVTLLRLIGRPLTKPPKFYQPLCFNQIETTRIREAAMNDQLFNLTLRKKTILILGAQSEIGRMTAEYALKDGAVVKTVGQKCRGKSRKLSIFPYENYMPEAELKSEEDYKILFNEMGSLDYLVYNIPAFKSSLSDSDEHQNERYYLDEQIKAVKDFYGIKEQRLEKLLSEPEAIATGRN